jgi:homocitrate synthase NifV
MALKQIYGIKLGIDTSRLKELSHLVVQASGGNLPPWKAIVGENAFAHESGIHTAGMLKNSLTYEPFAPEMVGGQRRLLAGKHSGRHLLEEILASQGIFLAQEELRSLLETVRHFSTQVKRNLTSEELLNLVKQREITYAS